MEIWLKRLENKVRDLSMILDYLDYSIFNIYKFKKIPRKFDNILVIDLLDMGDLTAITPCLRAIKENNKKAKVSILIKDTFKDLFKNNKNVDEILVYDKDTEKTLKEKKFDLGILLHPGSLKIGRLLKKTIPFRIGCSHIGTLNGKGFFLNRKVKPHTKEKHVIEYNLDVLKLIGINVKDKNPELFVDKKEKENIDKLLGKYNVNKKDDVYVIHTVGKQFANKWDNYKFAEVADYLIENKGKVIFTGVKEDLEVIDKIKKLMKNSPIVLAGETNLRELIALIERAKMMISIDTGPMHIAPSVKTKVIGLFGPGNPVHWRPYSKDSIVIVKGKNFCTGCRRQKCIYLKNYECMKGIHPYEVINAIGRLR